GAQSGRVVATWRRNAQAGYAPDRRLQPLAMEVSPMSHAVARATFKLGIAAVAFVALAPPCAALAAISNYQYVSPLPDSRLIRVWNDVIIRRGPSIRASTVSSSLMVVVGSLSGSHSGVLALSDDGRTLGWTPQ